MPVKVTFAIEQELQHYTVVLLPHKHRQAIGGCGMWYGVGSLTQVGGSAVASRASLYAGGVVLVPRVVRTSISTSCQLIDQVT